MKNIPILIQAAMGSSRLPEKSLAGIAAYGPSLIELTIQRASRAKQAGDLYVLVPAGEDQQPLLGHLRWLIGERHVLVGTTTKGQPYLEFCAAINRLKCEAFVRLTGDNPLVDPALIDLAIAEFHAKEITVDIVYTNHDGHPGYPPGFDVEVVRGWSLLNAPVDGEHVTTALYWEPRVCWGITPCAAFPQETRVTVDTPADLKRVRRIYADLGSFATYAQVVRWFELHSGTMVGRGLSQESAQPSARDETGGQPPRRVVGALGVVDPSTVTMVGPGVDRHGPR